MKLREETIKIQEALGAYCRTGLETDVPGLTPGRIQHYRRLISNVLYDTLERAFPIAMASLEDETWKDLVEDFFAAGLPQTPQVWKLPLEFYHYHAARETGDRLNLPYLDDLLYFEWMEIEVFTMPDRSQPRFQREGDLMKDSLAFNPEFEIIALEYPVHKLPVREAAGMKGDYYVLIYRLPGSGQVQFLDLTALHVYLITRLNEEQLPLREIKHEFARLAGIESIQYLDTALRTFLGDLLERQLILGYIKE